MTSWQKLEDVEKAIKILKRRGINKEMYIHCSDYITIIYEDENGDMIEEILEE